MKLTFGIFPGMAGNEQPVFSNFRGIYSPEKTEEALRELSSDCAEFLIRSYCVYVGKGVIEYQTPPDVLRYIHGNRRLDLACAIGRKMAMWRIGRH